MRKLIPFSMLLIGVASGLLFAGRTNAQARSDSVINLDRKADVRQVKLDWVYSIYRLRSVSGLKVPVQLAEYNDKKEITLFVDFGKDGSQMRKSFSYDPDSTTVTFLDPNGVGSESGRLKFAPNSNIPIETDLCPEYVERKEEILNSSDSLSVETCSDGSARATTLIEKDFRGCVIRELRTDVKKRTWEYRMTYNSQRRLVHLLFLVNDRKNPTYWQSVQYVDHKFDDKGNLISYVSTLLTSLTGNHIVDQLKAEISYEYGNKVSPSN